MLDRCHGAKLTSGTCSFRNVRCLLRPQQPVPFRPPCRLRSRKRSCIKAVSKSDLDELEMQIAVVNQEMNSAAKDERFQDAAEFRDRLERLRLRQRCLQIEHNDVLRSTICHRLGQIISHKRYKYRGVIFGVHSSCQASDTWIQTMGVDRLPKGRHQPFYQVLVDERDRPGGMVTYVAQENIEVPAESLDGEAPIVHHQISHYFADFDASIQRFTPSKRLISMYPDSLEARQIEPASGSDASGG